MSGCGVEPAITNAQSQVDSSDNTTVVATYTCNTGFSMSGSPRVTCNVTEGTWPTSGLPSCSVILQNTLVTTNVYVPDLHDEWWFYLLAALLGLIALVLLVWLLAWCCCNVCGCCTPRGTPIYPHPDHGGHMMGYRGSYWCCLGGGPGCDCCSRKHGRPERRHNTNTKGVYWIGSTNAHNKWEPGSPCTVCHSHNTLASSGLSIASSPLSGRDQVRGKNHAHSHSCRGQPTIGTDAVAMGGAMQEQTNMNRVIEMYGGGGGRGLAAVETPPPREAQLTRPVKPAKEPTKEAKIWMPHSNPVRQINTSTK